MANSAKQTDTLFGYTAEGAEQEAERLATDFKEPEVEKYVHPLETVPFFDRPMGASIKDLQVATVDGDPVFETRLGDRYTVRLNPDQRNLRAKIVEDVVPAVKEYLKDPTLPTKEQVVGAGKAVAEAVKETVSIPKDLLTGEKSAVDVTMGDVADIATMTSLGASAFSVPEDSLRMANVSGMFGKKKTPVEEYLSEVDVDLEEYKLVDLIDEDAKKNKAFNPRLQNVYNLTYNDVIKQEFKPLKFDETGGRRSTLIDSNIHDNNRLKSYVSKRILDRYTSLMDDSKIIKSIEINPAGMEYTNELDDWLKITTDITSNQVKEKFNRFLTEQPGLVLKLSAANKLKEKYQDEVVTDSEKLRSIDNLQQVTMAEILDRFFDETVVYTPDPGQIFKDRKFTFKVTDVDETGAQIQREVSPNFSGAFKDQGWDYGVYNFDDVYGNEGLENTFRNPLARALVMEFGDNVIDPKTKVTYVGERRMLEGEDLTPAETSPEGFDTEVTFQDIVNSIDKKLTDKREVIDVNTGKFENLGVEILTDFVNKKTGDGAKNLSETVLGADLLKLLENDPRMNVKNIPEEMKTQEFKNTKITLQDVAEKIIDDFDEASFNVRASPLNTPRYDTFQLQGDAGFEGGAKDKTYEVPVYSRLGTGERGAGFVAQKEHYGSDALSHVRFSVYEPINALRITDQNTGIFDSLIDNKDFILVEELQSDLISGGVRKFKRIPYTVEKTKRVVDAQIFSRKDVFPEASEYLKSYSDNLAKDMTEFFDQLDNQPPIKGEVIPVPDPDKVHRRLVNKYTDSIQKDVADGKISLAEGDEAQELLSQILTFVQEPGYFASESKYILGNKNIAKQRAINNDARRDPEKFGSPPIKKNIESVELNIQTLINQANDMGIDKIVFPSFDMIAAMRFKGDSLKAAIDNKSIKKDAQGKYVYDDDLNAVLTEGNALYKNYVTDFNKALNKFKTEYPEIKIETGVELPYKPLRISEDLRTDGVVIDISEMKKVYDLEKPKFAEGGVTMKDQMQMAFMQEGGLKDDGMDAKRGLADMESNGRIGGEPIDMPMDGMNQGGMMQTREQTIPTDTGVAYNVGGMTSNLYNNPTRMDQQLNTVSSDMGNNPQGMDMQNRTQAMMTPEQMDQVNPPPPPRGFNPGGLTDNQAAGYNYVTSPTTVNPMYQTPGASYMYAAPPQLTTTGVDSSIPSVENCAKMGMDYDPVGKVCIPKAAAQTPQQGGGSDDDGGPDLPKPDPDAWMDDYDYTGDLSKLAEQTGEALSSESFLPGPLGTFEKGVKMAHSAGHIILLQAQGKTTEAEQLLEQWNKARTGALALTPTEMIDGDRFAIQAAGAHGIKLDRKMESPIDGKPLFRNDRDYERYLANYEVSVRERRKLAAAKKVTETVADPVKTSKDITSDAQIKQMQKDREDSTRNINFGQKATRNLAGKDTATKTKITESATKDLSEKEKEGGAALDTRIGITGLNKGGLMSKKKKKK